MGIKLHRSESQGLPEYIHLENLSKQIESILSQKADTIDQTLLPYFQQIHKSMKGFHRQKVVFLKKFQGELLPDAQRVIEDLARDEEQLRLNLNENLEHPQKVTDVYWIEQATRWAKLYEKWQNHKELEQTVLKLVAERMQNLINRHIEWIESHWSEKELKSTAAIEGFRQKLTELKNQPDNISIQQLETVSRQRKSYINDINKILKKIESLNVVQDIIHVEETHDPIHRRELDWIITSAEQELSHIKESMKVNSPNLKEIKGHLEEIQAHLDDLPHKVAELEGRVDSLKNRVKTLLSQL